MCGVLRVGVLGGFVGWDGVYIMRTHLEVLVDEEGLHVVDHLHRHVERDGHHVVEEEEEGHDWDDEGKVEGTLVSC